MMQKGSRKAIAAYLRKPMDETPTNKMMLFRTGLEIFYQLENC